MLHSRYKWACVVFIQLVGEVNMYPIQGNWLDELILESSCNLRAYAFSLVPPIL